MSLSVRRAFRSFIFEPPLRLLIKAALTNRFAKRYAFESAALFDAVRYPAYAVGLQNASRYASLTGAKGFTAVEFGVAGGNGLVELSKYAERMTRSNGLEIKVVGFDAGTGLPESADYRDAPWLWSTGDFPCDVHKLRRILPRETELIVGRIEQTFPRWLKEQMPLPLGFLSVDVDLYSGTAAICEELGKVDVNCMLPIVSCYFDDILRFLTPRSVGEFAAIDEFNSSHVSRQFDRDDWLSEDRPFGERLWLKRMYSLCCFDHPVMRRGRREAVARLDLIAK